MICTPVASALPFGTTISSGLVNALHCNISSSKSFQLTMMKQVYNKDPRTAERRSILSHLGNIRCQSDKRNYGIHIVRIGNAACNERLTEV